MSRRDLIDPELRGPLDALVAMMPGGFNTIGDIVERRAVVARLLGAVEIPANPNVAAEDRVVPGPEGEPDITVRIYRPAAAGVSRDPARRAVRDNRTCRRTLCRARTAPSSR